MELFAHPLARAAGLLAHDGRILTGHRRTRRRQQQVEQPLLGGGARFVVHLVALLRPHHVHRELDEIADHRLDVAADIADFGELRRLDLDERRVRESRQPSRDLRLADAGRTDHQDVLGRDLVGHLGRQPLTAQAVAQRDRHGALGLGLTDDVLVQLGDDLARRQRADCGRRAFGKRNRHRPKPASPACITFFDGEIRVRVDADVGGDAHRLLGDLARRRACCAAPARAPPPSRSAARTHRHDAIVRLDEIAGAGQQKRGLTIGDDQHRFEAAEVADRSASRAPIRPPPVRGCRDTVRAWTRIERRAQRSRPPSRRIRPESSRCRAAESCGRLLEHRGAERDLPIPGEDRLVAGAAAQGSSWRASLPSISRRLLALGPGGRSHVMTSRTSSHLTREEDRDPVDCVYCRVSSRIRAVETGSGVAQTAVCASITARRGCGRHLVGCAHLPDGSGPASALAGRRARGGGGRKRRWQMATAVAARPAPGWRQRRAEHARKRCGGRRRRSWRGQRHRASRDPIARRDRGPRASRQSAGSSRRQRRSLRRAAAGATQPRDRARFAGTDRRRRRHGVAPAE